MQPPGCSPGGGGSLSRGAPPASQPLPRVPARAGDETAPPPPKPAPQQLVAFNLLTTWPPPQPRPGQARERQRKAKLKPFKSPRRSSERGSRKPETGRPPRPPPTPKAGSTRSSPAQQLQEAGAGSSPPAPLRGAALPTCGGAPPARGAPRRAAPLPSSLPARVRSAAASRRVPPERRHTAGSPATAQPNRAALSQHKSFSMAQTKLTVNPPKITDGTEPPLPAAGKWGIAMKDLEDPRY
ncbi:PREDICTED: uncharacterized protein LOC104387750 [Chaetura pelagica]|uniref:uncharacterized protein LOC104387750 n=1 Tax=Chaetura pelagica TaxID=8897 RepID=UPI000523D1DA|nr:PREDICTED: uncharacterized protein LOC104387750 [Chaetura pelagica]